MKTKPFYSYTVYIDPTYRSFQKFLRLSVVLAAPLIRAKRTLTPASPPPQNELQKSREVLPLYKSTPGDFAVAYLVSDEVDAWALTAIADEDIEEEGKEQRLSMYLLVF